MASKQILNATGLMAGLGRRKRDRDLGQVGKEAHKADWEGGVKREEERLWGWMAFHLPKVDGILEIPARMRRGCRDLGGHSRK